MDTTRAHPAPTVDPSVAPGCPVADVMRRVHAELRAGAAPSFEALLALGAPDPRERGVPGAAHAR